MNENKDTYSVEVREPTRGGDDYSENHYDFDSPEEVKDYLKNEMHEDESLHSVYFYPSGSTNPRDVTNKFQ